MDIVTPEVEDYVTKSSFDSNLITPGTTFLSDVCTRLRSYIKKKLSTDKLWKNLTVIFSDANCPG
jgi:5'-3' exoribonuclease 2